MNERWWKEPPPDDLVTPILLVVLMVLLGLVFWEIFLHLAATASL